jgi:hypothetical protein
MLINPIAGLNIACLFTLSAYVCVCGCVWRIAEELGKIECRMDSAVMWWYYCGTHFFFSSSAPPEDHQHMI